MVWLYALAGMALGAIVMFLWQERRWRTETARLQTAEALAAQEAGRLRAEHTAAQTQLEEYRGSLSIVQQELAASVTELRVQRDRSEAAESETLALVQRCQAAESELAGARAERDASRNQLGEQKLAVAGALTQMRDAFDALSREALQKNADSFLTLAATRFEQLSAKAAGTLDERKAQIETLLKPLQETLGTYQHRLHQIEQSRQEGYGRLLEQLGSLGEIGRSLERQTTQLVTALRKPTTRGQWGEITLRRLVELAGMSHHCDFTEQHHVSGADAQSEGDTVSRRPDMVVHLPNRRTIVVDSKATLDKFLEAAECEDEARRATLLDAHAAHIRERARDLSAKGYWNQFEQSPEFVIMFLPGEAFLYAAVERSPSIIEDAMRERVIISTPTTLIALLKAVEYGWRQEAMTQNAEEVRKLGVELYERIVVVAGHLGALGKQLKDSVRAYNSLLGSFESRVSVTARKLNELGAHGDGELQQIEPIEVTPRLLSGTEAANTTPTA